MTDTLPTTGSGKPRPMLGGGWIDGPCNPAPIRTAYDPNELVQDVAQVLAAAGVEGVRVNQATAVNAAADLLSAMGVTPGVGTTAVEGRECRGGAGAW